MPAELGERVTRARIGPFVVAKSLGRWLSNREGRWAGEQITVRRAGHTRDKVAQWRIEHLGPTGYPIPVTTASPAVDPTPPTPPTPAAEPAPGPCETSTDPGPSSCGADVPADAEQRPAPAAPAPAAPCSSCATPGPSCGLGAVVDDLAPCVVCGTPTAVRSLCGAPRHGHCGPGDPAPADPPTPPDDPSPSTLAPPADAFPGQNPGRR